VTRYATLLADPPWNVQQIGTASPPYALMSAAQVAALLAGQQARDETHLWLWVTNASLWAGKQVMDAWGFTYRSILTWTKPRFFLGNYLRNQTEHLLFGTKGKAPIVYRRQGTWLLAPVQDHSHKPEEQYAIIERCSPGPYLELFARRPRPGWHVWGDEVDSDVAL
jgi:N6-adenosine-specific RNA methylase IME4